MLLEVDNLGKSFGGVNALHGITFSLSEGQIGALIGPNGAGKTTLFNILTGVINPSAGEFRFQNRKLNGLSPMQIAVLGIARTFQNIELFSNMSVLENVMVGCHAQTKTGLLGAALRFAARKEERFIRETSLAMLDKVGLRDYAEAPSDSLPFGQKRLLEIARALAMKPKIILLDEPAAGLNHSETRFLVELIYRIRAEGTTVILVEHDMKTVMELADKIIVLNFGEKIAEGTPEKIMQNERVIEAYLGREVERPA